MEKVTVIFRKEKDGNVIALFPYMIWDKFNITCFDVCHGSADYNHVIKTTKLATYDEYKALRWTLINVGYDLIVKKKYNHATYLKAYYQSLNR